MYQDEGAEMDAYTEGKREMSETLSQLCDENGNKIDMVDEDRDGNSIGWVMRIYSHGVDNGALYAMAKEEAKRSMMPKANRIGRTWEDEDGVW